MEHDRVVLGVIAYEITIPPGMPLKNILAGKSGLVPFAGCRGLEVNAVTSMGFREVRA